MQPEQPKPQPLQEPEVMLLTLLAWSEHIAHFNYLSSRRIVATRYYDDELLNQMDLLDDIRWLFATGGMG